jgi:hypothetical protein
MNRGSDSVLSVYSDARAEYTKQLCMFLVPAYFQFYVEVLEKAKQTMVSEPKRALWQFQTYLNEIHDWNMEKVNHEIHTIHNNCGCDYMEDLLTAVFIAHTKVLTAIRLSANNKKVEINVPKVEHFLFKVLCETSKLLWSSTYLFRDGITGMEKQQNYRSIEQILNEGILQAVRNLVPVKSILKDFMNQDVADTTPEEDSDEEDKEPKESKEEPKESKEELKEPKELKELKEELKESKELKNEIIIPSAVSLSDQPTTSFASITSSIVEPLMAMMKPEEKKEDSSNPTIVLTDKHNVSFGKYNTVFSTEHPEESDMVIDIRDDESTDGEHVPALEIMEGSGQPLKDEIDFDTLDGPVESIGAGDYEEL